MLTPFQLEDALASRLLDTDLDCAGEEHEDLVGFGMHLVHRRMEIDIGPRLDGTDDAGIPGRVYRQKDRVSSLGDATPESSR